MDENAVEGSFTVFFDDPFWVGVYERREAGRLSVCRVVFGAEPSEREVYEYLLANWARLRFSPPVRQEQRREAVGNPKRMQRQIARAMERPAVGTKAQQALQLQREQSKAERKQRSRAQTEREKQRQFELKQQKRKEKHRGR
ncbi:MAG: YjdF family protein [Clostridia bacterium]|nr:YjdF family protein [Clostridia bacterium]